jgi:hypothetical protein
MFKKLLLWIIRGYKSISPTWPLMPILFASSTCKYYPTCGDYAHEAVTKYGARRGAIKLLSRILRCNPLSKGGVDLP